MMRSLSITSVVATVAQTEAHINSPPLSFCATEFPWPGDDRWLIHQLTTAHSTSPGLPETPFPLPRDPPQLQVQQRQLRDDGVRLLGAQRGLQPAVEPRESASALLAQPHPLQSRPLGQHDRRKHRQLGWQRGKDVRCAAASSTGPVHQQHLSGLHLFPLFLQTGGAAAAATSHLHAVQDRTLPHVRGKRGLQVRHQMPVCPRLGRAERPQQAPQVQDGALPHFPHHRLLPIRRPLPLHPQRRWDQQRQRGCTCSEAEV